LISTYYTQLKHLWDELASFDSIPACDCDVEKFMSEITNSNKLMQFLMGLNDGYDQVKNQILLLDPFPLVSKAYSMVFEG